MVSVSAPTPVLTMDKTPELLVITPANVASELLLMVSVGVALVRVVSTVPLPLKPVMVELTPFKSSFEEAATETAVVAGRISCGAGV